jgi:hypothetical protein
MSSDSITYTRSMLRNLYEENQRKFHLQAVDNIVSNLKSNIIRTANTNKTTLFYSLDTRLYQKEQNIENIINDTIDKLKTIFIDVTVEYKSQNDLRTGKEINKGFYIDWS